MSRQGLWRRFVESIRHSNKLRQHKKNVPAVYAGIDKEGNKYYQRDASNDGTIKRKRWVENPYGDNTLMDRVPMQWDQWLRGRHESPPTEEQEAQIAQRVDLGKRMNEKEVSDMKNNTDLVELNDVVDPEQKREFPKYEEYNSLGRRPD